jgi:hypothetical protein
MRPVSLRSTHIGLRAPPTFGHVDEVQAEAGAEGEDPVCLHEVEDFRPFRLDPPGSAANGRTTATVVPTFRTHRTHRILGVLVY